MCQGNLQVKEQVKVQIQVEVQVQVQCRCSYRCGCRCTLARQGEDSLEREVRGLCLGGEGGAEST